MKYLSEDIVSEIRSAVNAKYAELLYAEVDRYLNFFNSIADLREAFPDYDESIMIVNLEESKSICSSINNLIDEHYKKNDDLNFDNKFPDIVEQLDEITLQLEPELKVEQAEERFKPLANDKKLVSTVKRIKNIFFNLHQLTLKALNFILFKIKIKPFELKRWDQKIPLRNTGSYFLRNKLLKNLVTVYEEVSRELSKNSIDFWNYDEQYDLHFISNFIRSGTFESVHTSFENPEKIASRLGNLKKELKEKIESSINQCVEDFNSACDRVGTIELRKSKFKDKKLNNNFASIKNDFNKILFEWDNTFYALGEDWELNFDLNIARYSAIETFFKFEKSLSVKNKVQIFPQFNEIFGALKFITEKLNERVTDLQNLERLISFSKETLQKILLSSTLPTLINSISDIKFPSLIDDVSLEIKSQVDKIKEVCAFVKTTSYKERIKTSEVDEIDPREFVSFYALPNFLSSLEKIKEKNVSELRRIQSELINLGNMADFGLESAIAAALTENLKESEIKEIAVDAIKISTERKENIKDAYEKACEAVINDLRNSIAVYSEEMYSFSQSSKILEIKIQLAKAKASVKAKTARDKFFTSIKTFVPVLYERTKSYYKKGSRFYSDKRKQFGLTENKETITSKVSDFLANVNSSVQKLPYIYRRLFQNLPLENDRLYISREIEESQLEMAYNNWMDGNYASVIVSAEKGGGITSFINIFQKKNESKNTVRRLSIKPTIYDKQLLLKTFSEVLETEMFLNFDELVEFLNKKENRQVIVVENFQHLYLRIVKGFVCIKILGEVISKTSRNIFWLTSSTLYANEFLNKVLRLNDIFGYHILLKDLNRSQIIEFVKRRNSISGYSLEYELSTDEQKRKDFEKLSYEQQQSLLEKEFFNSLHKFAQSNISLALLFWITSITRIDERKVFINADFEISDSILKSLSMEKIFILQALVLHDGLRMNDLSKTLNYSLHESNQLTQILFNDGVLVKINDVFFINPLLYRQSVTLLKSKNLL
ncbi:MAG: hypothetical protein HKP17_05140 [Ignavibacteriaceae bacterium]|nr:hypothetical protein [Ignavibacteria bacterium]NNJ52533.1 hypothetical protein [Ignavibacteriaceae bacterium]